MGGLPAYKAWKKVFSTESLQDIYQQKIRGHSVVGLDWVNTDNFDRSVDDSIEVIIRKCNLSTYHFTTYRELLISKGVDKPPRCISIPTIRDKLVFAALNEVFIHVYGLESVSAPMPQMIIKDITENVQFQKYNAFIKTDIHAFYASLNHDLLITQLKKKIRKTEVCELVKRAITTGTRSPNTLSLPPEKSAGVPEGLSISNALANIYMQPLDEKLKGLDGVKYYRYVDDILVLTSVDNLENVNNILMSSFKSLLLPVNDEKSFSGNVVDGFEFLGYSISPSKVSVRKSSIINLERTLEMIFRNYSRSSTPNPEYLQWKINLKITGFILDNRKFGWLFFYSQINDLSSLAHLDWLIRNLCKRFNVDGVNFKSFLRAYNEITLALHTTSYIPNLDHMTTDEKRHIVADIYGETVKGCTDNELNSKFKRLMNNEIRNIQKDVQPFS